MEQKGHADSVLALDHHFEALLYFDEIHIPKGAISEEFAEVCLQLSSKFAKSPFDDPKLIRKVEEGVYLLGDGIIAGYKSALNTIADWNGASFDQVVLGNIHEIPDPRERYVVETMVVAQSAVQAGLSGANSCLHPDFLRTEVDKASAAETSPVMVLTEIPVVDVSRLRLNDVFEVRRDPGFRKSLRRLRWFMREEFHGLSSAETEDKFLTYLVDYERDLKRASDHRMTQSLSCFLGTSFWPSTLLLAATLLGSSLPEIKQLIAAGGVVALSAGRTLLEFKKANVGYIELREKPIDYVFRLHNRTK